MLIKAYNYYIFYKCMWVSVCIGWNLHISKYDFRLKYSRYFGGVENFRVDHFQVINGFSNVYFGWGMEDDDLFLRWSKIN
jgi:hypothetical protein